MIRGLPCSALPCPSRIDNVSFPFEALAAFGRIGMFRRSRGGSAEIAEIARDYQAGDQLLVVHAGNAAPTGIVKRAF